jgi:hypothetical protein
VTMANPLRGEVVIELDGKGYLVWYGWAGVTLLREQLGDDFDVKITAAMATLDLPVLAAALAIGLRDAWPGVTAERIAELSPPIRPVVDAISTSLHRTFHGLAEAPAEPDQNPPSRPSRLRRVLAAITSWMPTARRASPA